MAFKKRIGEMLKQKMSDVMSASSGLSVDNSAQAEKAGNNVLATSLPKVGEAIMTSVQQKDDATSTDFENANQLAKKADEVEIGEKKTAEAVSNDAVDIEEEVANATSEFLANQGLVSEDATATNYAATATKDQVAKDVETDYLSQLYTPAAQTAMKLGVQDYFPTIGDNIAVGTYSGRRIGSSTIYAAPGIVIPMGMLDARKEALQAAAIQKQKKIQKLQELPNAPAQFNQTFKPYAHAKLNDILARNNYDPDLLIRDKEGMEELYKLQTTAQAFWDMDATVDNLLKGRFDKSGKQVYYLPEEAVKEMYDFRSGMLEDAEAYFTGEKKISERMKSLKTYADGTRMVDSRVAELLKYPSQIPMNLKTGKEINEAAIAEINDAIKKARGGSGYDQFVEVYKKYYDINVDGIVDPWMNDAGYAADDPARQWVKDYFRAQIPPESLIANFERQANDSFQYYQLAQKRKWEVEDKQSYWETVKKKFEEANVASEITKARAAIAAETDPVKKREILARSMNSLEESGFRVTADQYDPTRVYAVGKVNKDEALANPMSIGTNRAKIYVYERKKGKDNVWRTVYEDGKPKAKWVYASDLASATKLTGTGTTGKAVFGQYLPVQGAFKNDAGVLITNEDFEKAMYTDLKASQTGGLMIAADEHRITPGWKDGTKNHKVTTGNIGSYDASNQKTLFVETKGNNVIYDAAKESYVPSSIMWTYESDLESIEDRSSLEVTAGEKQKNLEKYDETEGE